MRQDFARNSNQLLMSANVCGVRIMPAQIPTGRVAEILRGQHLNAGERQVVFDRLSAAGFDLTGFER